MSQSLAKVYLYVVPLWAAAWREELFQVIGGSANNLGCQSLIVGGVCDHVHQLLILGRTITIADARRTPSHSVPQSGAR
jgi:putative transposase